MCSICGGTVEPLLAIGAMSVMAMYFSKIKIYFKEKIK